MDALKQSKSGKLRTLVALWEDYDPLAAYGAYEVLIVCPRRFSVSAVGAAPLVTTPGIPACAVDHCFADADDGGDADADAEIPPPDILIVPDGDFSSGGGAGGSSSALLEEQVKEWVRRQPELLVVRVGPRALSEPDLPAALREAPPERVLRSVSGADMAVRLVEELAGGEAARAKAEDMIEYRGRDPFAVAPSPPKIPKDVFGNDGGRIGSKRKSIRLGVFLFEGFELLDTFGPMAAFVAANSIYAEQHPGADAPLFQFMYYAERGLVRSSRGPLFQADRLLVDDPCPQLDWLLIPGGMGTLTERHNPAGRAWARAVAERAGLVLTVCSGSGYLAGLGLLDGRRATTNKLAHDLIASWGPKVRWQPEARWVRDGKFWTSSGVAAGTDQALAVLEESFGSSDLANAAAHRMGWHHRVADGDKDCFVAKDTWWIEIVVINLLFKVLCSWLPKSWRPNPATIDKYLA